MRLLVLLLLSVVCAVVAIDCSGGTITVVETIPRDLSIKTDVTTYEGLIDILRSAKEYIHVADFYMTLTNGTAFPAADDGYLGYNIYEELRTAHNERNVTVHISLLPPSTNFPQADALQLQSEGVAEVRFVDWSKLLGAGILHTKMWVVDGIHAYSGSANADWRSLAQVKEMGLIVKDCPTLAGDLEKIHAQYWAAGNLTSIPNPWPAQYATQYDAENPMVLGVNDTVVRAFVSESPPQFCAGSRVGDIEALVNTMKEAEQFIYIEVMDFIPAGVFANPQYYWPTIFDAIASAAFRGVDVRLMCGLWAHTNSLQAPYLKALNELDNVEVKNFIMPEQPTPPPIPYARVNHAKYMVSDKRAFVSTSNWEASYFINTAGVTINSDSPLIIGELVNRFKRDWECEYVHEV